METENKRNRTIGGIVLILIGLVALLSQYVEIGEALGLLLLPGLGLLFLAWGILSRQSGFLIPGGILAGIGAGTLLLTGPYEDAAGDVQAAVFLLVFAAGWGLIPILSTIFTEEGHWWALIPGGILALIGAALLVGGAAMTALEYLGKIWPVFLILGGLFLILRRDRGKAPKS